MWYTLLFTAFLSAAKSHGRQTKSVKAKYYNHYYIILKSWIDVCIPYTFVFRRRFPWNLVLLGVFVSGCNYIMNRIQKRDENHAKNMLYLTDSCPLLHVWDDFKVWFWRLHKHTWSFSVVVLLLCNHLCFFYSYYDTKAVFLAMGITALVCAAVTVFCFQTKVRGWSRCFVSSLSEDVCQWKRTSLSPVTAWRSLNIHGICKSCSCKSNFSDATADGEVMFWTILGSVALILTSY